VGLTLDVIEMMIFAKDFENAEDLISKNSVHFNAKSNGKLAKLLNLLKLYHIEDKDILLKEVKELVDFNNLNSNTKIITDWDLEEAKFVVAHFKDSEQKTQLQNTIWYLNGQISGKVLCKRLNIDIEEA